MASPHHPSAGRDVQRGVERPRRRLPARGLGAEAARACLAGRRACRCCAGGKPDLGGEVARHRPCSPRALLAFDTARPGSRRGGRADRFLGPDGGPSRAGARRAGAAAPPPADGHPSDRTAGVTPVGSGGHQYAVAEGERPTGGDAAPGRPPPAAPKERIRGAARALAPTCGGVGERSVDGSARAAERVCIAHPGTRPAGCRSGDWRRVVRLRPVVCTPPTRPSSKL